MDSIKLQSHISLWGFLQELYEEFTWQIGDDPAPFYDFFSAVCYYLHPAYTYDRIILFFPYCMEAMDQDLEEIQVFISALEVQGELTNRYCKMVASRIKI
jgi:hypothetical protein